jgi:hypothetical protein
VATGQLICCRQLLQFRLASFAPHPAVLGITARFENSWASASWSLHRYVVDDAHVNTEAESAVGQVVSRIDAKEGVSGKRPQHVICRSVYDALAWMRTEIDRGCFFSLIVGQQSGELPFRTAQRTRLSRDLASRERAQEAFDLSSS